MLPVQRLVISQQCKLRRLGYALLHPTQNFNMADVGFHFVAPNLRLLYPTDKSPLFPMQTLSQQPTMPTIAPPATATKGVSIAHLSKAYGSTVVLEDVNLEVNEGEFVCVIGHSGCGKTTLLNMVSGFNEPTSGEVLVHGKPVEGPGPERMVVFQNYCLLPWKTVYENVYLAVNAVYPDKSKAEKDAIVKSNLHLVGLDEAMGKKPGQISGGMKQRVSIARALSIRPEVLILDEPFGALDAITKEELQEELLQIWEEHRITVMMITHDIDEALFLADRIVMMTNGPRANIGEIIDVPFARTRVREAIVETDTYKDLRNHALDYLYNRFAHTED
jgi:bicarbonate transport system ATP-binding protein